MKFKIGDKVDLVSPGLLKYTSPYGEVVSFSGRNGLNIGVRRSGRPHFDVSHYREHELKLAVTQRPALRLIKGERV